MTDPIQNIIDALDAWSEGRVWPGLDESLDQLAALVAALEALPEVFQHPPGVVYVEPDLWSRLRDAMRPFTGNSKKIHEAAASFMVEAL